MTNYALKTDAKSSKALDIQQAMIGEATLEAINKAGLKKGMQVWEYGCGNGAVTLDLAKIIGPQGHVMAIDQSAEQIKRVLEKAEKNQLRNITAKIEDIHTFKPPEHAADFVFGRYILMHLKNPENALMMVKSPLLKEGGDCLFWGVLLGRYGN